MPRVRGIGRRCCLNPPLPPEIPMVNLFEALFYIAASVVKALHRKSGA